MYIRKILILLYILKLQNFLKDTVIYCNKKTIKLKENKKLLNSKNIKNWLIIIDKKNIDTSQLYKPIKKYQKNK